MSPEKKVYLVSGTLILAGVLLLVASKVLGARLNHEDHYRDRWCTENRGLVEQVIPGDGSRVDCLTSEFAVEVEFANKWAESLGQAMFYALKTNREPGVVIILEQMEDLRYVERLLYAAGGMGIRFWFIWPEGE